MSIWGRISDAIASLRQGERLADVFAKLKTPPEKTVGFTIAVIALGAKMAKSDGIVSPKEVAAFRRIFIIPNKDLDAAGRVFDLARQDVSGYEIYAQRIVGMFGKGHQTLIDLLEGLFQISVADGQYHPNEDAFLERVRTIFGVSDQDFSILRARYIPQVDQNPYDILGLPPNASMDQVKQVWREYVKSCHPDKLIARGLPQEAIKLAQAKMAQINAAYDEIVSHQLTES